MKTTLVINPQASGAESAREVLAQCAERRGWQLVVSERPGDAARLTRCAAEQGAQRVIAVGGDGTVSHVVSALMTLPKPPALGVIPIGTGNDFARSLHMPLDVAEACEWLAATSEVTGRADVLHAASEHGEAWAVNSINGGIANAIRAELDRETKSRWGAFAFLLGGLEVASDVPSWSITLGVDDGPQETVQHVVSVIAANARSVGGGFDVAPAADIEDGMFDLVIISGEKLLGLLSVAVRSRMGLTFDSEHVRRRRCRRVTIDAPADFAYTVDGEAFTGQHTSIEVLPAALPFVAGPDYRQAQAQATPREAESA